LITVTYINSVPNFYIVTRFIVVAFFNGNNCIELEGAIYNKMTNYIIKESSPFPANPMLKT